MTAPHVFLDTAYAVALASRTDEHHTKALTLAQHIAAHRVRLVTTRAVCLEVGDALARLRFRPTAIRFLESLQGAPTVEIVPASETLCAEAFDLYRQRPDKEWGLTDCMAFVVMTQHGLTEALTTDEHFEQAGFKALLRD
ncbi:MAG: type II toxin-antitoxin system VapC family toxin [Verrucomicrobia bacterium]|nr:type II toxin-antitoxin system VapC family toxin [Verrucomicrobiota bacterium]